MDAFAAYGHALTALVLFALIKLVLGPVSAARKSKDAVPSGAVPPADYASAAYRLYRAHQNAVESLGPFGVVTIAAILAGAAPLGVNWAASIFLLSRIVLLVVHLRGWGRPDVGLRTYVYLVGFLSCLVLGLLALAAVFGGAA